MLIYKIDVSETASSGAWSFNTPKIANGLLKQIIIKAATATTTFDVTITDDKDNIVYFTDTKATGTLRHEVNVPFKGIHTIDVSNSSVDEAFTGKISIQEL